MLLLINWADYKQYDLQKPAARLLAEVPFERASDEALQFATTLIPVERVYCTRRRWRALAMEAFKSSFSNRQGNLGLLSLQ